MGERSEGLHMELFASRDPVKPPRHLWITETDGEEMRYSKDPESSFWQRFKAGFIKLLPVEGQL